MSVNMYKLTKLNDLVTTSFRRKHIIVLNPEGKHGSKKKLKGNAIYDEAEWKMPEEIRTLVEELSQNSQLSNEDKILEIYEKLCRDYVYDDNVISYIKKKIQHMCDKSEELSECITYYVSNMDIIDYRYRIDMEYEGYTQFDNLSWGYGKMITGLMTDITGYDRKELWHAFRHAREGKIIENSSVG